MQKTEFHKDSDTGVPLYGDKMLGVFVGVMEGSSLFCKEVQVLR